MTPAEHTDATFGPCGAKAAHDQAGATRAAALENMDALAMMQVPRHEPYRCDWCGHWHVGKRRTLDEETRP